MKWFRFYWEALYDPKVQELPSGLFKHWVNILCLAGQIEEDGRLPDLREISFALRLKPCQAAAVVERLEALGLIDRDADGTTCVHNWCERQRKSDDAAPRKRRQRNAIDAQNGGNVTGQSRDGHALEKSRVEKSRETPSHESLMSDSDVDARGFDEIDIEFPKTHTLTALKTVVRTPEAARWASSMCPDLDWKADTSDCFRYIQANPKKAISDLTRYWQDWLRRKQREHERDVMKAAALAREESSHDKPVTIPERGLWILPLTVAPPRPDGYPPDVVPVSRDGFVQWFFPDKIPPGAQDLAQHLQHGQALVAC